MFQGETVTAERFAAQPALSKTNKKPVFSHLEKCLKGQKTVSGPFFVFMCF
jgi:hypothetical protein